MEFDNRGHTFCSIFVTPLLTEEEWISNLPVKGEVTGNLYLVYGKILEIFCYTKKVQLVENADEYKKKKKKKKPIKSEKRRQFQDENKEQKLQPDIIARFYLIRQLISRSTFHEY